jgi:hypothetical protein
MKAFRAAMRTSILSFQKAADEIRKVLERSEAHMMPELGNRPFAIPLAEKSEWHSGTHRRLGIDLAVADEHNRSAAEFGLKVVKTRRVRLAGAEAVATDDSVEQVFKSKVGKDLPGWRFGLVGQDAKQVARPLQLAKGFRNSRIRPRQVGCMRGVVL